MLRNARHERVAQALALGSSAQDAYERAGYAPGARAATVAARLSNSAEIKARVAEIKECRGGQTEASVASILDELEQARRLAIEIKQPAAAVSASMGKARITGMIAEKAEGKSGAKLSFELTETEAARRIAFILRRCDGAAERAAH